GRLGDAARERPRTAERGRERQEGEGRAPGGTAMKSPKETVKEKIGEKHVNRTGIALSPKHSKELIDGATKTKPSMAGDEKGIATVRAAYSRGADPIGSIPPPATPKG